MRLAVIGCGVVGLVTGASFAKMGHQIISVDKDLTKVRKLQKAHLDFFEPGLQELIQENASQGRLRFTTSISQAVKDAEVIFITVGTPPNNDGSANLSSVHEVATEVAASLEGYAVVVEKSTVPVGTGQWLKDLIQDKARSGVEFDVASVPEFLREGAAIQDFLQPTRVVIGVESPRAEKVLRQLFEPLDAPILVADIKSAELIKHAANCFLAMKISYVNALSIICEQVGADVTQVAKGIGLDPRIGQEFLAAGVGYGGSCFPKDISAFVKIAEDVGYDFQLLKEVARINREQRLRLMNKLSDALGSLKGRVIGVLGLSFKPNTDDMREAPSVDIVEWLLQEGASVRAYDPVALPRAKTVFGESVQYSADAYDAAKAADAVVLLTEWKAFKNLDMKRLKACMKGRVVVDGRNIYDPGQMRALGFQYYGIGR
ncbi:MAG: UDP-glucose/GDP-mannose dehydrogenase family protein [Dehalococcoidia bacterium]|nr:UDP-glucose/GDP-mannose dehydrogenase family protein [Dehalococcoidia bacterium]